MKKALVTGANRGIGFAIAEGLAAHGYNVIIGARNIVDGEKAAKQLGVQFVQLDVASPESIRRAVAEIGDVEVLINNAGILGSGGVLDDVAEFETSMATMLNGPFLLMHLLVPGMRQRGYGRVVNVSSDWGAFSDGLKGPGGYSVAKAALNALTLSAANSLPDSVKVNCMCPGWVRTRMGGTEAHRSPQQGAETAVWLATLGDDGPTGKFFRDKKEFPW